MTQDERKVIELALEASKDLCTEFALAKVQEILTNALAQPEQEPFEYWNAVEGWVKIDEVREHLDSVGCGTIYKIAGEGRVPLSLAKAQPEQEPVAWYDKDGVITANPIEFSQPLYTTPPQRKPLNDEMRKQMKESCDSDNMEMRGAFIDGWTSAEVAHGIKE